MAEGCPKRLIVLCLELEWRCSPRFLGGWFCEVICKAFGGLDMDSVCACITTIEGTRKGDDSFV